ncbi:MAG: hypothetical protein R3F59_25080 [Myxococcota bacterium]
MADVGPAEDRDYALDPQLDVEESAPSTETPSVSRDTGGPHFQRRDAGHDRDPRPGRGHPADVPALRPYLGMSELRAGLPASDGEVTRGFDAVGPSADVDASASLFTPGLAPSRDEVPAEAPAEKSWWDSVTDGASTAWNATTSAASWVGDQADSAASWVADSRVGRATEAGLQWTGDQVRSGIDAVADTRLGRAASTVYGWEQGAANWLGNGLTSLHHGFDRGVDTVEKGVADVGAWAKEKTAGVPVLGRVTAGVADLARQTTELGGGVLKAGTTLVDGVGNGILHPGRTAQGLYGMLEHVNTGVPNPLKAAHALYDVAARNRTLEEGLRDTANPVRSGRDDAGYWGNVASELWKPYQASIDAGKPMEAVGRGVGDALALLAGTVTKPLSLGGKTAEVAEAATAAERLGVASDATRLGERAPARVAATERAAVEEAATFDRNRALGKDADVIAGDHPFPVKKGDAAFARTGPARVSDPEAYTAAVEQAKKAGAVIEDRPGAFYLSAVEHAREAGHPVHGPRRLLERGEAQAAALQRRRPAGFPGAEALLQPKVRWEMERAAYGEEISLARRRGDTALVKQLEAERTVEWQRIFKPSCSNRNDDLLPRAIWTAPATASWWTTPRGGASLRQLHISRARGARAGSASCDAGGGRRGNTCRQRRVGGVPAGYHLGAQVLYGAAREGRALLLALAAAPEAEQRDLLGW